RHRVARGMGGGDELLRAGLALRALLAARGPRDLEVLGRSALERQRALALGEVALPDGARGAVGHRHGCSSRSLDWCDEAQYLLPEDLDDQPLGPPAVEFGVEDRLPRAEVEPSLRDRQHDLVVDEQVLPVRVAVVFSPAVVAEVAGVG